LKKFHDKLDITNSQDNCFVEKKKNLLLTKVKTEQNSSIKKFKKVNSFIDRQTSRIWAVFKNFRAQKWLSFRNSAQKCFLPQIA